MNLLPQMARKELLKEYWVRVMSVCAILVAFAAAGVSAAFLPSYVLMESKQTALGSERAALAGKDASIASVEEVVLYTNTLAASLKQKESLDDFYSLIVAIKDIVPSGVTLQSYVLQRSTTRVETIEVTGIAVSRDALIAFQEGLRAHERVGDAVIPIKDFVQERDLPFAVTIIIKEVTP